MKSLILRALVVISALAWGLQLAGCNTLRGLGQDVQRAGAAVENAAKK